jgi:hypothetical protein
MPPSVGSVEMTNSGVTLSSLWMYCQHRPSQSSSCTVPVTRSVTSSGMRPQILHDLGAVNGGDDAALLVGAAAAADLGVRLVALVGVKGPVVRLPMPTVSIWAS